MNKNEDSLPSLIRGSSAEAKKKRVNKEIQKIILRGRDIKLVVVHRKCLREVEYSFRESGHQSPL